MAPGSLRPCAAATGWFFAWRTIWTGCLERRALSISYPYEKTYIREAIDRLLQANELAEARLRLTLTNGPLTESEEQRKPTLLITATEFRPYPPEYYKAGVLVILCPFRQNPTDPTCGHKTTSYYPRLLALNLAHQKRAAEALWFTTDNRLAEGCVSNVFLVKNRFSIRRPWRRRCFRASPEERSASWLSNSRSTWWRRTFP